MSLTRIASRAASQSLLAGWLDRTRLPQAFRYTALGSDRLDPSRERLREGLQEFTRAVARELAVFIEELVDMADIGFRLLHGRHK